MIGFNQLGNAGRLGNQMFQYASLMGIAKNRNFDWAIPPKEVFGTTDHKVRESNVNVYDAFKLSSAKNQKIIDGPYEHERTPYFDRKLFDHCPDNVSVDGYLQDEKYFKHIKKDILREFDFLEHTKKAADSIMKEYVDAQKVSIHIRRTDYLTDTAVRSIPTLDYYNRGMSLFKNSRFFIFSDDIEWCKAQPIFCNPENKIVFFDTKNAYVDLCLMSLCDHNIIANSSYSWWGSYLNKNPNKIVVAPSKWLDYRDASHMYLEDWIVLK